VYILYFHFWNYFIWISNVAAFLVNIILLSFEKKAPIFMSQDSKNIEPPPKWKELVRNNEEMIEEFLKEVSFSSGNIGTVEDMADNNQWTICAGNDDVEVSYQKDEPTGTYRLKLVGKLPFPVYVVEVVMFNNALRKSWDHDLECVKLVSSLPNGDNILHILLRTPPPVRKRDLVHIRTHIRLEKPVSYEPPSAAVPHLPKSVLVVDTSPEKSESMVPYERGYVRAFTYFTAGLIEPIAFHSQADSAPSANTLTTDSGEKVFGSLFTTVVQVDPKGFIPQFILKITATRSSLRWFGRLKKACESYVNGQLAPRP
jgi:hypothetical protein